MTEEIGKETDYRTHSVIWYLDLETAKVRRIADGGFIYGYVSGDEQTLISAGFTENVTEDRKAFSLKIADECEQQVFAEINGRFYLNTARVDGVSDRMYMAESDYGYNLYLLDTTRHKLVRYLPFSEEGNEVTAKMYWRAEDEGAVIAFYQDKAYVFSSGAPRVLEIAWTMMELQEAENAK